MLFTPNKSGQRSPPTYYRGCWHVVSRGLFTRYRPFSSLGKAVYDPQTFILHAALLRQTCVHCGKFLTKTAAGCPWLLALGRNAAFLLGRDGGRGFSACKHS